MSAAPPLPELPKLDVPEPLNHVIAIVGIEPADLEALAPGLVHFVDSFDDMDHLKVALLKTEHATFALVRHHGAPEPGIEVHAPERLSAEQAMPGILKRLGLGPSDVVWTAPCAAQPGMIAASRRPAQ